MFFSKQNILLDTTFKSQVDLFRAIATIAYNKQITQSEDLLVKTFLAREATGSTGFEDGFAIPHARGDAVLEPAVFIVRNQSDFKGWTALDGQGVKIAILLCVPKVASAYHIDVLAAFAGGLMDQNFRTQLKAGAVNTILGLVNNLLAQVQAKVPASANAKAPNREFLIGISACPAGIAHTFMVKDKMEQIAREHNLEIKWETQGANGQKNPLTRADIKRASYIIIASDIELDLSRFKGAKVYQTTTNDVIKNANNVFAAARASATSQDSRTTTARALKKYAGKLLMAFKSSFQTPWYYFSVTATLLGLVSLIGFSMYGTAWRLQPELKNSELFRMQLIATIALYFAMPLVGANVAQRLTLQKEAFYIVLLAGIILNMPLFGRAVHTINGFHGHPLASKTLFYDWNGTFVRQHLVTGANVIGTLVVTMGGAVVINLINGFKKRLQTSKNKVWKWMGNNLLSPWITVACPAAIMLFSIVFFLGAPLAFLSRQVVVGLIIYPNDHWWLRFLIGSTFGVLIAWDLGGTVNKITIITLVGLAQYDLRLGAIIPVAIPVASLGLGLSFAFNQNQFRDEDKKEVSQSFSRALKGMSEGPMLLTNKYGGRVRIINLAVTGFASGLIYMLGVYIFKGGFGGILVMGAQAHLATSNDLSFLNHLLPLGRGFVTFIYATLYGIIAYYLVMIAGGLAYAAMAQLAFKITYQGKRVFK